MDEQLIEKVREHEVLYNHSSHEYRDQHIRQSAWEEIGKELNISGKYKYVYYILIYFINYIFFYYILCLLSFCQIIVKNY